jgi:hypothetical protein
LKDLPADIKAKMIHVHYQDNVVRQAQSLPRADGFAQIGDSYGFVPKGYELDVEEWLKTNGAKNE